MGRVLGDAVSLPLANETFDAVAALYMLYHFDDPLVPIREAYRVLKPGGLFAACAPSRHDDPELAPFMPARPLETFDSDNAPELLGQVFEIVRIDAWNMPLYRLPDAAAVWTYLVSRMTDAELASDIARRVETPLWLTKRGATVWGRRRARAAFAVPPRLRDSNHGPGHRLFPRTLKRLQGGQEVS